MDSQDRAGAVNNVVKILRRATRIVQLAPFAYLAFYIAYMLFGYYVSEETLCLADSLLTMSPLAAGTMLVCSHIFHLCIWHKTACLLPMASQVEGYIDSFVITFTQEEVLFINTTIGLFALAFFVLAIKHFAYA